MLIEALMVFSSIYKDNITDPPLNTAYAWRFQTELVQMTSKNITAYQKLHIHNSQMHIHIL